MSDDFEGYSAGDQLGDQAGSAWRERDLLRHGSRVEMLAYEFKELRHPRRKDAPRLPSFKERSATCYQKGYQFGLTTDSVYPDVSRYDDQDWAAQAWHRGFKDGRTAREDQG